jgi:uncharacterized protein YgbK (DUF1537 family)
VQFADRGMKVLLSIDVNCIKEIPTDTEVWIINTHSRSESEPKAIKRVKKAIEYLQGWNADYYYKKIDSTLRGNIGMELEAIIESLQLEKLPLCAAFPQMGRITVDSIHYVNGKKVSESAYSEDVQFPVKESNINKLLALQMKNPEKIEVKDASSDKDLENLTKESSGKVFAGAAAWAGKLADYWLTSSRKIQNVIMTPGPVLVVSGSMNPVSLDQIEFWGKSGFYSIDINETSPVGDFGGDILIKTLKEKIEGSLKKLTKVSCGLWISRKWDRVILNGGDTAYGFMTCIGVENVQVIKSLMPGIALIKFEDKYAVLKPGGYGKSETLVKLARMLGGK